MLTRKDLKDFEINTMKDVKSFITYLVMDLKLMIHPDDPFTEYIDENDEDFFDEEAAEYLDGIMEECFDVCDDNDKDIYGICCKVMDKAEKEMRKNQGK